MTVPQWRRLAAVALVAAGAVPVTSIASLPSLPVALQGAVTRPVALPPSLPPSLLAVREGNRWRTWWRSEHAPARWTGRAELAEHVTWRPVAPGMAWGAIELAGSGEAWRTDVIVVLIDPRRARLALDTAFTRALRRDWSLDRVPEAARVAVNAGQFVADLPWGWVVLDGKQYLPPGRGPLASAFVIDTGGHVRWQHGPVAAAQPGVAWAFQSYPTLLDSGRISPALTRADAGIDVFHRDARLAIGTRPDGTLVIAMTRFGALGERLGMVPFGLTTPEMAAVMGALGTTDAVLLDGGISAQLLVRESGVETRRWAGIRRVPLALLVYPRSAATRGN